jgi:hypothetical protein
MALISTQLVVPVKTVTFVDAAHSTSDGFDNPLFSYFDLTDQALKNIQMLSKVVSDYKLRSVETDLDFDCHFHKEWELRLVDWKLVVTNKEFWVTTEIKHSDSRVETDTNLISSVAIRFDEANHGDTICLANDAVLNEYRASRAVFGSSDEDKAILLYLAASFKDDSHEILRLSEFPHFSFQFEGEELIFTDEMRSYFEGKGVSFKDTVRQLKNLSLVSLHLSNDDSRQLMDRLVSELKGELQSPKALI